MADQRAFIATLWQGGKPVSEAIATTNDCYVAKAFHLNSVRCIYAVCANQGVEKGAKATASSASAASAASAASWRTRWTAGTVATLQLAMAAMAVRVSLTSDLTAAFRASKSSGRNDALVGVGTAAPNQGLP